jgi:hypothetical protein
MKTCKGCSKQFPATLEYFSRNRNSLRSRCKICLATENSAWRKANLEKQRIYHKNALKRNPEKYKQYKEKWKKANPEKVKSYERVSYLKNIDERTEKNKAWRKDNPEKVRSYKRNRRAKIRGNGYERYTDQQVLDLYGTNCYLCDMPINLNAPRSAGMAGWKTGLHIEHFIDIALGGSDTLDNVRPSHGWCNLTKPQRSKDSVELSHGTV